MVTQELQKKLREQDITAYNYIYEKYGWELHNYLREKCPDKEVAAEIFCRVMHQFCTDLSKSPGVDVLEIALCMYADQALRELAYTPQETATVTPVPPEPAETKKAKTSGGFGQVLLMLLLLTVVAAALWVILGQIMRIGLFPGFDLDLGYTWFNQHIASWF